MKRMMMVLAVMLAVGAAGASLTTDTLSNSVAVCRETNNVALDVTMAPNEPWALEEVRFAVLANTTETLAVTSIINAGTTYTVTLASQAMNGLTCYRYQPTRPIPFGNRDGVRVTCANHTLVEWALEIVWRKQ